MGKDEGIAEFFQLHFRIETPLGTFSEQHPLPLIAMNSTKEQNELRHIFHFFFSILHVQIYCVVGLFLFFS